MSEAISGAALPVSMRPIARAAIAESAAEKIGCFDTPRGRAESRVCDSSATRRWCVMYSTCTLFASSTIEARSPPWHGSKDDMIDEAQTYGKDFPAYQADPLTETLKAMNGMAADQGFANDYAAFRRDMVYGEAPDFQTAMATLQLLAQHLQQG